MTSNGTCLRHRWYTVRPSFASSTARAFRLPRFLSCRRQEKVAVVKVVPDRSGGFAVKIPAPAGAKAAIYRALTKVASHARGTATVPTFTLPRAIDLPAP